MSPTGTVQELHNPSRVPRRHLAATSRVDPTDVANLRRPRLAGKHARRAVEFVPYRYHRRARFVVRALAREP